MACRNWICEILIVQLKYRTRDSWILLPKILPERLLFLAQKYDVTFDYKTYLLDFVLCDNFLFWKLIIPIKNNRYKNISENITVMIVVRNYNCF